MVVLKRWFITRWRFLDSRRYSTPARPCVPSPTGYARKSCHCRSIRGCPTLPCQP